MVTDAQLLLEKRKYYPNHTGGAAAKVLASKYDLNPDSVRGRLSTASRDPSALAWVDEQMQKPDSTAPSVLRQHRVVKASWQEWEEYKKELGLLDRMAVGYFISDRHLGAPQVPGAWELTLKILMDEPHVDVWSAHNDWLDNNGQGRWEDTRSSTEKLWDDSHYAHSAEANNYRTIREIHPNSFGLSVLGNHDIWRPRRMRENDPANAEVKIADRMEELKDLGVLMFNRFEFENYVRLNRGLVWNHGISAASRISTQAKRAWEHFTQVDYIHGTTYSTVVEGHTHRPGILFGKEKGYPGVKYVSAGAYYDGNRVAYSKTGENPHWRPAIVRCEFDVSTWQHKVELIEFLQYGNDLVAEVKGKLHSVTLG